MRMIVFWTKNPKPMLERLDEVEALGFTNYYFQFTLNDYDVERLEPNVPPVAERIDTFKRLANKIGKERVIWRFDPLLLSDKISVDLLLKRIDNIGQQLKEYTEKLVFSFIDIGSYRKVQNNLAGFGVREFSSEEQVQFAKGLAALNKEFGFELATCGELADLSEYGIKHNKCVDDELMMRLFNDDAKLMEFIGAEYDMFNGWQIKKSKKDKGQRKACGCIVSKDIGMYNTCPHLCRYCYANSSEALVKKNFVQYSQNSYSESII
jgi:DNA repair photolyase